MASVQPNCNLDFRTQLNAHHILEQILQVHYKGKLFKIH